MFELKRIIYILFSLFLLFMISCTSSPKKNITESVIDSHKVFLETNWNKGEIKEYEITNIRHSPYYRNNVTNKSNVKIEIIKKNKNGYLIRWSKKPNKNVNITESLKDGVFEDLLNNGLVIEYKITKSGEIIEITNRDELNEKIVQIRDSMIEQINMIPNISYDQRLKLYKIILKNISIENEEGMFGELILFHSIYGQEYENDQYISYKTELPSTIGNYMIPAEVNVNCEFINNDTLRYTKVDIFDSEVLGKITKEMTKDLIPEYATKEIEWSNNSAENYLNIDINMKTTWPIKIQNIRSITMQGREQKRTYIISEKL